MFSFRFWSWTVYLINPINACLGSRRDPERHINVWHGSCLNFLTLDRTLSWGVSKGEQWGPCGPLTSESPIEILWLEVAFADFDLSDQPYCRPCRSLCGIFSPAHLTQKSRGCLHCWQLSNTGSQLVLLPELARFLRKPEDTAAQV